MWQNRQRSFFCWPSKYIPLAFFPYGLSVALSHYVTSCLLHSLLLITLCILLEVGAKLNWLIQVISLFLRSNLKEIPGSNGYSEETFAAESCGMLNNSYVAFSKKNNSYVAFLN